MSQLQQKDWLISQKPSRGNILFTVVLSFLFAMVAHAQWSHDPANNLIVGYGLLPEICSDSAGGAYITYENATTYPRKIALRRLNRFGYQAWSSARLIQGIWPESRLAKITEDGRNGVLIGFTDIIVTGQFTIDSRGRVQRVDSNGNLLWGPTGTRVTLAENNHGVSVIASDGHGGCVVAWVDTGERLRCQRIDSMGVRVWEDTGVVVSLNIAGGPFAAQLLKISQRKFLVGYSSNIFSSFSMLQCLDLNGNMLWGPGSRLEFLLMNMKADGRGGAVCSGRRAAQDTATIVVQRVDSTGSRIWQSPFVVLAYGAGLNNAGIPISVDDGGNSTFAWAKASFGGMLKCYAQRVMPNGENAFAANGISVSRTSPSNGPWGVHPSVDQSSIYLLADSRLGNSLFGQRLDSLGQQVWDTNDVRISVSGLGWIRSTTDCKGGAIVVGYRDSDFAVRAQQISRNGLLGEVIVTQVTGLLVLPRATNLFQSYPNPLNPNGVIEYELRNAGSARLVLYNLIGQVVEILADGEKHAGRHRASVSGSNLASGVYIYRLETADEVHARKLIIAK